MFKARRNKTGESGANALNQVVGAYAIAVF
jgi:hypothetical protein